MVVSSKVFVSVTIGKVRVIILITSEVVVNVVVRVLVGVAFRIPMLEAWDWSCRREVGCYLLQHTELKDLSLCKSNHVALGTSLLEPCMNTVYRESLLSSHILHYACYGNCFGSCRHHRRQWTRSDCGLMLVCHDS